MIKPRKALSVVSLRSDVTGKTLVKISTDFNTVFPIIVEEIFSAVSRLPNLRDLIRDISNSQTEWRDCGTL